MLERILSGWVEFGHPNHPLTLSETLAGDNAAADTHNGLRDNIAGSWVEVEVTALDTPVICNHNLGQTITAVDANDDPTPNVRWLLFAFQHDGAEKVILEDLRGPAGSGVLPPGVANPSWQPGFAGSATLQFLRMSGTGGGTPTGSLYYYFQIPHSYRQGTAVSPHIHWCKEVAVAGNVRWEFEYTNASPVAAAPEVFPASTATATSTAIIGGTATAWEHSVSVLPSIPGAGLLASEVIVCRITRNQLHVDDTYAVNHVAFLEMDLHFQVNSHGSDGEFIKSVPGLEGAPISAAFRQTDGVNPADTVTEDYIELRFHSPWREVSVSHPLKATLFFIPAVRG